jgi:hypothetical protein
MDVLGTIDFPGIVDFSICSEGFLHKGAYLFLISGVSLDSLHNQAMRRTAGLLSKRIQPRAQLRRQANGGSCGHNVYQLCGSSAFAGSAAPLGGRHG